MSTCFGSVVPMSLYIPDRAGGALSRTCPVSASAPGCPLTRPSLQRDSRRPAPRSWRRTGASTAAKCPRQGRNIGALPESFWLLSPRTTHARAHLQIRSAISTSVPLVQHTPESRVRPSPLTARRPRGMGPIPDVSPGAQAPSHGLTSHRGGPAEREHDCVGIIKELVHLSFRLIHPGRDALPITTGARYTGFHLGSAASHGVDLPFDRQLPGDARPRPALCGEHAGIPRRRRARDSPRGSHPLPRQGRRCERLWRVAPPF